MLARYSAPSFSLTSAMRVVSLLIGAAARYYHANQISSHLGLESAYKMIRDFKAETACVRVKWKVLSAATGRFNVHKSG